ncbi:RNA polymerase sigma-70 factor [Terrimonas sp.]|uniref:sigma-70 family RNA polymerase sigma factor n=1 Tax=Terrimonas sp. TaxID=1914338 RepID=UPI000D5128BE|nr:sigma-70 family RNA polymerase sigma factor [Terrimonas sp.]PVD52867.1 RNA polymerase sigma-70 factor [Terrimonas sp.]
MTPYSTYDEVDLLILLRRGDSLAFTEIYNRYWDRLFFVAGKKLNDFAIAEEVVQDIFSDIWFRREHIIIPSGFSIYLAAALKYKVINIRIKRQRELKYLHFVKVQSSLADNTVEGTMSFEALQNQLSETVAKLPERCQLSFRLSREEGLKQKEIAQLMNISEKAVEHNISRALKTLRTSLRQFLTTTSFF